MIYPEKILSIEVAGDTIRGVLLGKKGKKFLIRDFASLKRPLPDEDLPDIDTLKQLARLLNYTGRHAVYVTALARSCGLFMSKKKVAGMSLYKLSEAAKWEIEPYTGITGGNALVGVEKETPQKAKPGEIIYEDESEDLLVNISAIEKNVYVAIKERFKAAGLKLKRIYPPEVSFYMPLFLENLDSPRAILEIGQDYSNFAIFKGRHPDQINTLNFSCDSIRAFLENQDPSTDLVDSLKFTFSQAPPHEPVMLTGPGASIPEIADYLSRMAPSGAAPLLISKTAGVTSREEDPADAVFGTAAGAGIRELSGKRFRSIGINDASPLSVRIKKNAYIMPLIATGIISLGLLGHNQYMKYQDRKYKADIQVYTAELEKKKEILKKYEALQKSSEEIKKDIRNTRNKIDYIRTEADKKLVHVITCFDAVAHVVPEGLVLDSILQEKENQEEFRIKGYSFDLDSIGAFAVALQKYQWGVSAAIRGLNAGETGRLIFELILKTEMKTDTKNDTKTEAAAP